MKKVDNFIEWFDIHCHCKKCGKIFFADRGIKGKDRTTCGSCMK